MSRPNYAVFLPVRNGAAYLREAIDSVISQTNGAWMLFVLDNASSDGSAELASSYAHPNIHVYRSASSLSIFDSWQRIWSMLANSEVDVEYSTIIGHDDRLSPNFLETIDKLITENPSASLYQTAFDLIDAKTNLIRPCRPIPSIESAEDFLASRFWGLRDSVGTGYVFRSKDYIAVDGIADLPYLLYADDLLFARLAKISFKAASSIVACQYRLHRQSTSHQLTRGRIEGQIAAIESYIEILAREFSEFMNSMAANSALSCFLAREVMMLRPLVTELLLGAETCQSIHRLEALYLSKSRGVGFYQWLGTNYVSSRLYAYSKRTMLFNVLLRSRLRWRSNRAS